MFSAHMCYASVKGLQRVGWSVCADASGNSVDCHLREFACDGRCIPRSNLCDHEIDCAIDTAADESPHLCSKSTDLRDTVLKRSWRGPDDSVPFLCLAQNSLSNGNAHHRQQ